MVLKMIKWKRPSGSIIETNETDETIEHAVKSKWKRVKPEKDKPEKDVEEEKDLKE
jgi:hypothetical protein